MTASQAAKAAAATVDLTVAVFAGIVSYSHIYDLARAHGQTGAALRLLPLSVDLLIMAGSIIVMHEGTARPESPVHGMGGSMAGGRHDHLREHPLRCPVRFPRCCALGVATAVSFIVATHALFDFLKRAGKRASAKRAASASKPVAPKAAPALAPAASGAALMQAATETFGAGPVPSLRIIQKTLKVGQPRAQQVQAHLAQIQAGAAA
jgi:hypothetical protein